MNDSAQKLFSSFLFCQFIYCSALFEVKLPRPGANLGSLVFVFFSLSLFSSASDHCGTAPPTCLVQSIAPLTSFLNLSVHRSSLHRRQKRSSGRAREELHHPRNPGGRRASQGHDSWEAWNAGLRLRRWEAARRLRRWRCRCRLGRRFVVKFGSISVVCSKCVGFRDFRPQFTP